jgi:hypothetical protein
MIGASSLCCRQLAQLNQLLSSRQSGGSDTEPKIRRIWPSEAHVHDEHADQNKQTEPEIGRSKSGLSVSSVYEFAKNENESVCHNS